MKYKYKEIKCYLFMLWIMGQKVPGPATRYKVSLKNSSPLKCSKTLSLRKVYHFEIIQPLRDSPAFYPPLRVSRFQYLKNYNKLYRSQVSSFTKWKAPQQIFFNSFQKCYRTFHSKILSGQLVLWSTN